MAGLQQVCPCSSNSSCASRAQELTSIHYFFSKHLLQGNEGCLHNCASSQLPAGDPSTLHLVGSLPAPTVAALSSIGHPAMFFRGHMLV